VDKRFAPNMAASQVDACRSGWQRAVRAAKAWADDSQ
jgi:glycerol kinase